MRLRRHLLAVAAAVGLTAGLVPLFALTVPPAWSQTARTLKIVVPYPPGGPADVLARLLGEQIGRERGPTIVVENRPGAGGRIGTEAVSRATPDGNTLLIVANPFVIDPHLRKVDYHPLTDFEPICYLAGQPTVIVVNSNSSYYTLAELFDAARAKPGHLTLASTGPATVTQIAFEMLKRAAKVDVTFVPYAGAAPALSALLGGHVTSALVPYSVAAEQVTTGKLRTLAIVSRQRIEQLAGVPTVAKAGYEDIEADLWNVLVAPAKTPKEALSQLVDWFAAALHMGETKSKLAAQGQYPAAICGAEFAAFLRKQYDDYGRIIREANIKAE
jgi:tripartite-type tricarboxylate transporter receptor subunit TctC